MEDKIIKKLRNLIAHEKSARFIGNLQEAEAFAARVQDLLTAHKLSMSEIDFEERETAEPIDWERVDPSDVHSRTKRFTIRWKVTLANAIGKVNSCRVIKHTGSRGNSFSFVGRTSDRELAKMLYIYMVELGDELGKADARKNKEIQTLKFNVRNNISDFNVPTWAAAAFRAWMREYSASWLTGFGDAIAKRLNDRYEETLAAHAQVSSNAIIHIRKDILAVNDFLRGKTTRSQGHMAANNSSADGYAHGHATGSAVNLSPNRFAAGGRGSRLLGA